MTERYNTNPIVTVIIPCFNCDEYIEETIDSLDKQSYKKIKVLCIDDGSTDGTLNKLNKLKEKYSFLEVIHQENKGVSSARNLGISLCESKYLTFLDSDDTYSVECIEWLVKGANDQNCNISYCHLTRKRDELAKKGNSFCYKIETETQAMKNLLYDMGKVGFSCFLYNTEMLNIHNIRFDEDIKYGEDRSFIWKYICHFENVAFLDAYLYWYRENQSSATQKKQNWRRTDSIEAVQRTIQYLKNENCVFWEEYSNYMYPRDMWAVCKSFSISGDLPLFKKLLAQYNVRECMKITIKDKNMLVRVASWLFIINPMLYYYAIRAYGRLLK